MEVENWGSVAVGTPGSVRPCRALAAGRSTVQQWRWWQGLGMSPPPRRSPQGRAERRSCAVLLLRFYRVNDKGWERCANVEPLLRSVALSTPLMCNLDSPSG